MKSLDKNKTKELDWVERFRKENEVLEFSKGSWIATGKYVYCEKLENKIKQTLTQQRTELLEEIKDLQTYVLFNDTEKLISLEQVINLINKKDE